MGKIARLPHDVREELNRRLRDGAPLGELLPWLNGLPETRALLDQRFGGAPISEQNLSRWKTGGFLGWLEARQVQDALAAMTEAGRGVGLAGREALNSQLALALSTRLVGELRRYDAMPDGPDKTGVFKGLVWAFALLRRGECEAGKLELERRQNPPPPKPKKQKPLSLQEQEALVRQEMGIPGPTWNNFTKQWEGEGAAERTEREEVEQMAREELQRRKELRMKEAELKNEGQAGNGDISANLGKALGIPATSDSLAPQSGERGLREKPLSPALSPQAGRERKSGGIVKLTPMGNGDGSGEPSIKNEELKSADRTESGGGRAEPERCNWIREQDESANTKRCGHGGGEGFRRDAENGGRDDRAPQSNRLVTTEAQGEAKAATDEEAADFVPSLTSQSLQELAATIAQAARTLQERPEDVMADHPSHLHDLTRHLCKITRYVGEKILEPDRLRLEKGG